jgi:hypothetical protein
LIKKRFLKLAVLVFFSSSVFGSFSWFFYYQKRNHDLLEGAKERGVLFWNQKEIENENGYILITAFGVGCSLIKRDGSLVARLIGIHCNILENGDVVTNIFQGSPTGFVTRVRGYQKLWKVPAYVSHDISISPIDKSIWYVDLEFEQRNKKRVKIDTVINLSPDGEKLFRWRPQDHMSDIAKFVRAPLKEPIEYQSQMIENGSFGYFHINSVQIIPPNSLSATRPEFRTGNILLTDHLNGLAIVVDRLTEKVVWVYQVPAHCGLHTVRWLPNNHLLMFANRHPNLGTAPEVAEGFCSIHGPAKQSGVSSSAIEVDPVSGSIVWSFNDYPLGEMDCSLLGSVQRLSKGHTIISYGCERSSVIEIDESGAVLWKWRYPPQEYVQEKNVQIYRSEWLPNKLVDAFLQTR